MLFRLRGTQPSASNRYQHYLHLHVIKCFSVYEEPGLQPQTGISTSLTWPSNAFPITRNPAIRTSLHWAFKCLSIYEVPRRTTLDRCQHYLHLAFKCFSVYEERAFSLRQVSALPFHLAFKSFPFARNWALSLRQVSELP
jgi:hypothetical protein